MKVISGPSSYLGGQLPDYSLLIDNQKFKVGNNRFDVTLRGGKRETFRLMLLSPEGKGVAGAEVPLWLEITLPPAPEIPTSGTAGDLLLIHCPCTGTLTPDAYFNIGGIPMPILTATAGTVVVRNAYELPGITEIETNVGGVLQKTKFRNLTLKVSADKLDLLKGETTQLHVVVGGLQGLETPARMTINASGVINMAGGNLQTLSIDPARVNPDGTYNTGRTLTAISAGTFGVQVVVAVDE
jgi:hypothetical protein